MSLSFFRRNNHTLYVQDQQIETKTSGVQPSYQATSSYEQMSSQYSSNVRKKPVYNGGKSTWMTNSGPPSDVPSDELTKTDQDLTNFSDQQQRLPLGKSGAIDDLDKLSRLIEDRQKSLRNTRRKR